MLESDDHCLTVAHYMRPSVKIMTIAITTLCQNALLEGLSSIR